MQLCTGNSFMSQISAINLDCITHLLGGGEELLERPLPGQAASDEPCRQGNAGPQEQHSWSLVVVSAPQPTEPNQRFRNYCLRQTPTATAHGGGGPNVYCQAQPVRSSTGATLAGISQAFPEGRPDLEELKDFSQVPWIAAAGNCHG